MEIQKVIDATKQFNTVKKEFLNLNQEEIILFIEYFQKIALKYFSPSTQKEYEEAFLSLIEFFTVVWNSVPHKIVNCACNECDVKFILNVNNNILYAKYDFLEIEENEKIVFYALNHYKNLK